MQSFILFFCNNFIQYLHFFVYCHKKSQIIADWLVTCRAKRLFPCFISNEINSLVLIINVSGIWPRIKFNIDVFLEVIKENDFSVVLLSYLLRIALQPAKCFHIITGYVNISFLVFRVSWIATDKDAVTNSIREVTKVNLVSFEEVEGTKFCLKVQ